jgi:hypothetical protein
VNIQPVTDEPRRNAVEHAPQDESAARRDKNARLLVVGRSSIEQWLEHALDLDRLRFRALRKSNHLVDEAAITGEISNSREPRSKSSSWSARLRCP